MEQQSCNPLRPRRKGCFFDDSLWLCYGKRKILEITEPIRLEDLKPGSHVGVVHLASGSCNPQILEWIECRSTFWSFVNTLLPSIVSKISYKVLQEDNCYLSPESMEAPRRQALQKETSGVNTGGLRPTWWYNGVSKKLKGPTIDPK